MIAYTETEHVNVILVDDEIDACRNLQKILLEYVDPGIRISGHAYTTHEAEKKILEHKPDVVFLDIEMPHENAYDFLERISPINFEVIFVTAYDEYAVRAFKLNAVDYILKPISIEEVSASLRKAKDRIAYKKITGEQNQTTNFHYGIKDHSKLDRIRLKDNNGFDIVDFKDILYIEAKGSYSNICFLRDMDTEKNIITSNTLNEYEELFPRDLFFRIHRSFLINCMHVKKVSTEYNSVKMRNKVQLPVSRRRITELMEFFKKK